jgi:hypothetical protein
MMILGWGGMTMAHVGMTRVLLGGVPLSQKYFEHSTYNDVMTFI